MKKDKLVKDFIAKLKSKFYINREELFEEQILMINHSELYEMINEFEKLYNKGEE